MDVKEEPTSGPVVGRLVNHGTKKKRSAIIMLDVDDRPALCLFASKHIPAGTEILYDYGIKVPWESKVCFTFIMKINYSHQAVVFSVSVYFT